MVGAGLLAMVFRAPHLKANIRHCGQARSHKGRDRFSGSHCSQALNFELRN